MAFKLVFLKLLFVPALTSARSVLETRLDGDALASANQDLGLATAWLQNQSAKLNGLDDCEASTSELPTETQQRLSNSDFAKQEGEELYPNLWWRGVDGDAVANFDETADFVQVRSCEVIFRKSYVFHFPAYVPRANGSGYASDATMDGEEHGSEFVVCKRVFVLA